MIKLLCTMCIENLFFTFLGFFLSVVWAIFLYLKRPKLKITSVEKDDKKLIVRIDNTGKRSAINLNIEACGLKSNKTYHFEIDKGGFIALPPKRKKYLIHEEYFRKFKVVSFDKSMKDYNDDYNEFIEELALNKTCIKLRIRIHAYDSFTGFGKFFEQKFQYQNGCFKEVD